MTRQRSQSIRLAAHEPLCEPSVRACAVARQCMRFMAGPVKGQDQRDYSTRPDGGTALCDGYLDLRSAAKHPVGSGQP